MPRPAQGIPLLIVLERLAAIATLAWVLLFLGFISGDGSRIRGLFFLLAPTLGAAALGFSLAIRFLTRNERGRTSMSVASVLFAAALVLLGLSSWEWYQITIGASYCTACIQFFYLPLFGIFAAVGGFVAETVGIWQRRTEQRLPRDRDL